GVAKVTALPADLRRIVRTAHAAVKARDLGNRRGNLRLLCRWAGGPVFRPTRVSPDWRGEKKAGEGFERFKLIQARRPAGAICLCIAAGQWTYSLLDFSLLKLATAIAQPGAEPSP